MKPFDKQLSTEQLRQVQGSAGKFKYQQASKRSLQRQRRLNANNVQDKLKLNDLRDELKANVKLMICDMAVTY
jgi:hypothetical protein